MSNAIHTTPLPQNINLTDEQIEAAGATIIPLYIYPYEDSKPGSQQGSQTTGQMKVAIPVIITAVPPDQLGGNLPPPVLYEFDTGGKGFWADGSKLDLTGCITHGPVFTQYTSGITYLGTATDVYVSLLAEVGPGPVTAKATIGVVNQILAPDKQKGGEEAPSSFPIFQYLSGDFGASLQATATTPDPKYPLPHNYPIPQSMVSMLSVLPQLQYNNGSGFIVDVANTTPYPGGDLPAATRVGRLILGGVNALGSLFATTYQLDGLGPFTSDASTSILTYSEEVASGTAYLQDPGENPVAASGVAYIMDTGATITTFYPGGNLDETTMGQIQSGDTVVLNLSTGPTLMNYTVGEVACRNFTKWGKGERGDGCINTGLALFRQFPVLFDLDKGTICFPPPG
jgi:hypothetical protein